MTGRELFASYAFPPNELGYCGPPDTTQAELASHAKEFDGAWPYLQAIADAGLGVRDAIRSKEPEYAARGLGDPGLSDDALLEAMVAAPILINRPFVFTHKGVRLCRPPETVLELLD